MKENYKISTNQSPLLKLQKNTEIYKKLFVYICH